MPESNREKFRIHLRTNLRSPLYHLPFAPLARKLIPECVRERSADPLHSFKQFSAIGHFSFSFRLLAHASLRKSLREFMRDLPFATKRFRNSEFSSPPANEPNRNNNQTMRLGLFDQRERRQEIGKYPDDAFCEKFGSASGEGQQRRNHQSKDSG
jgi:hypothetical protein